MASWRRRLLNGIRAISYLVDLVRFRFSATLGLGPHTPLVIADYKGFGNPGYVSITGRVLQNKFIRKAEEDSTWQNFINTAKRFNSNEITDAQLVIHIGDNAFELTTDDEGYYHLENRLPVPLPADSTGWQNYEVQLTRTPWQEVDVRVSSELLIPSQASFGVISDLDDTVIQTGVNSLLKLQMLYLTILKNARKRRAFRDVDVFFNALRKGTSTNDDNPFFYVSNSPWNIYDLLEEFLHLNQLPKGPVLLRDFGIIDRKGKPGHKYRQITHILNTYPTLPFLLVGDSGEKDAEIYLSIARAYPKRIKAIFIHDVQNHRKALRISRLIKREQHIPVFLFQRYSEALHLAEMMGVVARG